VAVRKGIEKRNLQFRERNGVFERSFKVGTRVEALGSRKDHWECTRSALGARKLGKGS